MKTGRVMLIASAVTVLTAALLLIGARWEMGRWPWQSRPTDLASATRPADIAAGPTATTRPDERPGLARSATQPAQGRGSGQFNLANAPKAATWTLQIAHYVDPGPAFPATELMQLPEDWDRKQAALDCCVELRKLGIEAYFYHGPTMSMVTVGSFPADVVKFAVDEAGKGAYEGYDPQTDVYTDGGVRALRNKVITNAAGQSDTPFRYNLENGLKVIRTRRLANGQIEKTPMPSFLVKIPGRGAGGD